MGPGVKATVPGTLEGESLGQVHEQPQGGAGVLNSGLEPGEVPGHFVKAPSFSRQSALLMPGKGCRPGLLSPQRPLRDTAWPHSRPVSDDHEPRAANKP